MHRIRNQPHKYLFCVLKKQILVAPPSKTSLSNRPIAHTHNHPSNYKFIFTPLQYSFVSYLITSVVVMESKPKLKTKKTGGD